jgi:hypothetical protein
MSYSVQIKIKHGVGKKDVSPTSAIAFYKKKNMNLFKFLALFVLIPACIYSTEKEWVISENGIGPIHIGLGFTEFRKLKIGDSVSVDTVMEDIPAIDTLAINTFQDGKRLIRVYNKGSSPSAVGGIVIESSKFKTKSGIRCGLSLEKLKKIMPGMKIRCDDPDGNEYIIISESQTTPKIIFMAIVTSKNGNSLVGIYPENEISTEKFNPNAIISSLEIYRWE